MIRPLPIGRGFLFFMKSPAWEAAEKTCIYFIEKG